ncbi:MAG: hypothetical protein ACHQ7N_21685 [Candidatus Methylomirabilales bacterium]
MKSTIALLTLLGFCAGCATTRSASDLSVLPTQRQSPEQLEADSTACREVAKSRLDAGLAHRRHATASKGETVTAVVIVGAAIGVIVGLVVPGVGILVGGLAAEATSGTIMQFSTADEVGNGPEAWDRFYTRAYRQCLEERGYTVQ